MNWSGLRPDTSSLAQFVSSNQVAFFFILANWIERGGELVFEFHSLTEVYLSHLKTTDVIS